MNVCHLSEVSFVVLDEADRMLNMGFEEPVCFILSKISLAQQMVMFSATWSIEVHKLAQEYMDPNPVKVVVGLEDLAANHDVMQIVEVLDDRSRDQRLLALLEKYYKSQRLCDYLNSEVEEKVQGKMKKEMGVMIKMSLKKHKLYPLLMYHLRINLIGEVRLTYSRTFLLQCKRVVGK